VPRCKDCHEEGQETCSWEVGMYGKCMTRALVVWRTINDGRSVCCCAVLVAYYFNRTRIRCTIFQVYLLRSTTKNLRSKGSHFSSISEQTRLCQTIHGSEMSSNRRTVSTVACQLAKSG